MYIIDICEFVHIAGVRSSGSCRVAWLNMQFVYQTVHSKTVNDNGISRWFIKRGDNIDYQDDEVGRGLWT